MYKYSVSKPEITQKEIDGIIAAVSSGWISSQGPQVKELEEKFAKYIGTKYAVACSSGTTALQLALASLNIGKGDEVIVPEFTMIATAWAVSYVGATPVFVDCSDDLNIDVEKIHEKITPRTKAIIPVHIYGRVANVFAIRQIAYEYNLRVIEDACEAHGAEQNEIKAGALGDIGCFSLFANKIITAGEGGLITTNDEHIYRQLQHLKAMAFNPDHTFYHPKIGYNFRMTNMQAACALAQLERINEILDKRRRIQEWYDEDLKSYTINRPKGSVLWMYDMRYNDRDGLVKYLKNAGIETRVFFKPMSMQPMYRAPYEHLEAFYQSKVGLYLPTYTGMTREDVKFITSKVLEYEKR